MLRTIRPKDPLVNMGYVESQFNRSSRTIHDWIKAGVIPEPMRINGYKAWAAMIISSAVAGSIPAAPIKKLMYLANIQLIK